MIKIETYTCVNLKNAILIQNKDFHVLCRNCGAILSFELCDINASFPEETRFKRLPHIQCVECGKQIQLHSKYRNYKKGYDEVISK